VLGNTTSNSVKEPLHLSRI